jgi:hypothetical protein
MNAARPPHPLSARGPRVTRAQCLLKHTRRVVPLVALAVLGFTGLGVAAPATAEDLTRVSTSVELKKVAPVLRRIAKVYSKGFGRSEAAQLAQQIDALPVDRERTWDFAVEREKAASTLHVRALLDNLSMVDLDFSTDAAAAARIRKAIDDVAP